jgi:hypothetical protein
MARLPRYSTLNSPDPTLAMHVLMLSDVYFPRINGVSTSIHTFRHALHQHGVRLTIAAPEYPGHQDIPPPKEDRKTTQYQATPLRLTPHMK